VWDYYATGDHSKAHVYVVNQRSGPLNNVNVSVRFYNLDGVQRHIVDAKNLNVPADSSMEALTAARVPGLSSVYFVRCQMTDEAGKVLAENVYWESLTGDDLGPASNDSQFQVKWAQLADMTALNTMPSARVAVAGTYEKVNGETRAHIRVSNSSKHVAFFLRTEISVDTGVTEILPIRYDDNYITVFPREDRTIEAVVDTSLLAGHELVVRVEGYDVPAQVVPLTEVKK
jgi:exo-1,4-beta-D-glucosaminidase